MVDVETIMFYGGIAGAIVFFILILIIFPIFKKQRKKLLDEIDR